MDEFAHSFYLVLLGTMAVALVIGLVSTMRPGAGGRTAKRTARRARLPLDGVAPGVESYLARLSRVRIIAGLGLLAITFPVIASAPVADAQNLLWLFIAVDLGVIAAATVVLQLHERLFHPAPDALRIARARTLDASDYIAPRRLRRWCRWASHSGRS